MLHFKTMIMKFKKLVKNFIVELFIKLKTNSKNNLQTFDAFIKECQRYDLCVIVGNGPSLSNDDLLKIKNAAVFVSNKFFMNSAAIKPTAYFSQDPTIMNTYYEEINAYNNSSFYFYNMEIFSLFNKIKMKNNSIIYRVKRSRYIRNKPPIVSTKLKKGYGDAYTVTGSMLQVALNVGFKTILLIGNDFNYIIKNGKVDQESYPIEMRENSNIGLPNVSYNYMFYQKLKIIADELHVRILNVSRQTKLDIFEKDSFDNWF